VIGPLDVEGAGPSTCKPIGQKLGSDTSSNELVREFKRPNAIIREENIFLYNKIL